MMKYLKFINDYIGSNDPVIKALIKDLVTINADITYLLQTRKNDQVALDFSDALNELSVLL